MHRIQLFFLYVSICSPIGLVGCLVRAALSLPAKEHRRLQASELECKFDTSKKKSLAIVCHYRDGWSCPLLKVDLKTGCEVNSPFFFFFFFFCSIAPCNF
ncbi:hypothetical protein M432DRAFT_621896 [Thermoascus aurantiacus ATCC 26904]